MRAYQLDGLVRADLNEVLKGYRLALENSIEFNNISLRAKAEINTTDHGVLSV